MVSALCEVECFSLRWSIQAGPWGGRPFYRLQVESFAGCRSRRRTSFPSGWDGRWFGGYRVLRAIQCPSKKENRSRCRRHGSYLMRIGIFAKTFSDHDRGAVSSNRRLWNLFCAIQRVLRRARNFSGKRVIRPGSADNDAAEQATVRTGGDLRTFNMAHPIPHFGARG